MTDEGWKAIAIIFPSTIGLATFVITLLNNNRTARIAKEQVAQKEAAEKMAATQILMKEKQSQMHDDIDGKMSELLKVTGEAEKAKGNQEGRQQQTAEANQFKDTSDANAQKIIEALKEVTASKEPTKVVIEENKDKEVIIKENRDKGTSNL